MGGEIWDRFTTYFTPPHGSWLKQAEIEIGLFARQCLGNRRIPDVKTLRRESRAWNRRLNRDHVKINWNSTGRPPGESLAIEANTQAVKELVGVDVDPGFDSGLQGDADAAVVGGGLVGVRQE